MWREDASDPGAWFGTKGSQVQILSPRLRRPRTLRDSRPFFFVWPWGAGAFGVRFFGSHCGVARRCETERERLAETGLAEFARSPKILRRERGDQGVAGSNPVSPTQQRPSSQANRGDGVLLLGSVVRSVVRFSGACTISSSSQRTKTTCCSDSLRWSEHRRVCESGLATAGVGPPRLTPASWPERRGVAPPGARGEGPRGCPLRSRAGAPRPPPPVSP